MAERVAGRLPDRSLQGNELLAICNGRIVAPAGITAQFRPLVRVTDLVEAYLWR